MKKKEKVTFVDDGRTIADMNVDGMPWYNPSKKENPSGENREPLSKSETLAAMKGIILASLLIALVFVAGFTLFILFARFIWLK